MGLKGLARSTCAVAPHFYLNSKVAHKNDAVRAGTENVPGIVGFSRRRVAARRLRQDYADRVVKCATG